MDVGYLRSIGKVESFPVSIDSSLRNKVAYPTPAEYEVEFDTPFQNVVGFDVLDASIPNTMYVVDTHNNAMAFAARVGGNSSRGWSIDEYLAAMSASRDFQSIWRDDAYFKLRTKFVRNANISDFPVVTNPSPSTDVVIVDKQIDIVSLTADITDPGSYGALPVDSGTSYRLVYDLGRNEFLATTAGQETRALPVYRVGAQSFLLVCANISGNVYYGLAKAFDLVDSPFGHGATPLVPSLSQDRTRLARLDSYGVYRVTSAYYDGISTHAHELHLYRFEIETGDHDIDSLVAAIEFAMPTFSLYEQTPTGILLLSGTSAINPTNYGRQKKIRFSSTVQFWMDMEKSTLRDVLGFSQIAPTASAYRIGDNLRVFKSVRSGSTYSLDGPGIISLVGERLLILRCPQIEEQTFSSLSKGNVSSGIGVFKLYDATVAHLRFDFTKLARLDFHPIGKLPKLKIRFETTTGKIYDFKSADHHIFISIRFLAPRTSPSVMIPSAQSLNPDYDPDVLKYIVTRDRERDESDTDSDNEILNDQEHAKRFKENRRKFLLREEMMVERDRTSGSDSGSGSESDSGSDFESDGSE